MRVTPTDSCRPRSPLPLLAAVFAACVLCVGCSSDKTPILEDDSQIVIALKKTGADVERIPTLGMPNMTGHKIDLTGVDVDSEILELLEQLQTLVSLKLTGEGITDETLARVGKWKNLRDLDLGGSAVTDAGLKHLSSLGVLGTLLLNDTKVTGSGLADVPPSLNSLNLTNLPIDDNELKDLKHLKKLRAISVAGTQVTASGASDFEKGRGFVLVVGIKRN